MRSSLTLLAALGAALVVAGVSGGAGGDDLEPNLDPNVALEMRAARPAQTLPGALRTLADETASPAVARAIRAGLRAPSKAGLQLPQLLAPFSAVVLSVERACPPPALLACRPAVRFIGRLRPGASGPEARNVEALLLVQLEAAGFEDLHAQQSRRSELASRITSRVETLARWRLTDGELEVVTGGLALESDAMEAPTDAAASSSAVQIELNAELLSSLVNG